MFTPAPVPVKRSTFVTVLSSIVIGLSGFMATTCLLANVVTLLAFVWEIHGDLANRSLAPGMLLRLLMGMLWIFVRVHWFSCLFLLLALTHLSGAIALLLRKNWGRLLFIGMLVFDSVYPLVIVAFLWRFMQSVTHTTGVAEPQPTDAVWKLMVMWIFCLVVALGLVGLFGWIIRRLRSEPIRREFTQRRAPV